jgi:hypothetical protein
MKIHITKNGQSLGQFSLADVNQMLESGEISANDLAWQEGMAQWVPVCSLPGVTAGAPPLPSNPQASSPVIPARPVASTIPNYLVQSILVTLFCCLPFGVIAIVNASQVNDKIVAGDTAGAMEASRKAKMWCLWSAGIGLVVILIYFVFVLVASIAGAR